jgi:hypothetical protein
LSFTITYKGCYTCKTLLSLIYSVTFYILLGFILFVYSYYCDRDYVVDAVGRKNA